MRARSRAADAVAPLRLRQVTVGWPWCERGGRERGIKLAEVVSAAPFRASICHRTLLRPGRVASEILLKKLFLVVLAVVRGAGSDFVRPRSRQGAAGVHESCRVRTRVPSMPHSTLITCHPAPANSNTSSWMIWPLPRTGPYRRWRLQLTTKVRWWSRSREASVSAASIRAHPSRRHRITPQTLRLVAVARAAAMFQIMHEAGVIDGGERADAHRAGRELPQRASARDQVSETDTPPLRRLIYLLAIIHQLALRSRRPSRNGRE